MNRRGPSQTRDTITRYNKKNSIFFSLVYSSNKLHYRCVFRDERDHVFALTLLY